jgi:anti-anti-sigma factor
MDADSAVLLLPPQTPVAPVLVRTERFMVESSSQSCGVEASAARPEADEFPLAFGAPPLMRGRVDRVNEVVTLTLDGEFDLVAREAFRDAMETIEATNPRGIVVNVQGLSFMDSTGIQGLFDAHQRAAGARTFAILNGSGPAHRTLKLVGLDRVLTMVDRPSQLPGAGT